MNTRIPAVSGWAQGRHHEDNCSPDRCGSPASVWRQARTPLLVLLIALGLVALLATAAAAQALKTYTKKGSYDDVKLEVTDAITKRGLVVDFNGNVGGMLDRTGKDVGSTTQIYKKAEYFAFCSAKLSRDIMEANTANLGYCPFVVFIYETAAKPGEIVVGYRQMPSGASGASAKAFAGIDALLDGIAKEAVK